MANHFTEDQRQNVIYLYKSRSIPEIAILTGLTCYAINQILNQNNITRKKAGRKSVDKKNIIDDFDKGFSEIAFLARKYNCTQVTVRRLLIATGRTIPRKTYEHKNPANKSAQTYDIIAALNKMPENGESLSTIARKFNVSRQYVHYLKNQLLKDNKQ